MKTVEPRAYTAATLPQVVRFILEHLGIGGHCHVRFEHWPQFHDTARELHVGLTRRTVWHSDSKRYLYRVTRTF